jgi:hypothetical protein
MDLMLNLPIAGDSVRAYRLTGRPIERPAQPQPFNRIAYAAAHVVSDPTRDLDPWNSPAIDWDADDLSSSSLESWLHGGGSSMP